jgi:hypothetical protein
MKTQQAVQSSNPSEYIKQFTALIEQGKQCWIDAGKILCEAVEKVPNFVKILIEHCPQLTERFIRKMIDLGHGSLHPELLIGESIGERNLAKLTYSWQEKYVESPVELLIKNSDKWDTLLVPVRDLTPEQCKQVFDGEGIRTEAQQRIYLENSWAKKTSPPSKGNLPYRVTGKELIVMEPTRFSRRDLAKLLAEMES